MIVVIAFQFDIDECFIFANQVKEREDAAVARSKQVEEEPEVTAISQSSDERDKDDDDEDTESSDSYYSAQMFPEETAEPSGTDQIVRVSQQLQELEELDKGKITPISIL